MDQTPVTWRSVSRAHRCPVCQHDSYCSVSERGVCCRRVAAGKERLDRSGALYWWHPADGAAHPIDLPPVAPSAPAATARQQAAVYAELLAMLSLNRRHAAELGARGLTGAEIKRRGYRSLPGRGRAELARRLVERHGQQIAAGVPGLYVREDGERRWWSLAGAAGLLIPVRDLTGRVRAITIRADDTERVSKYSVLSSKSHGGPGPGACVHVPLHTPEVKAGKPVYDAVRITEGHLKADVATALSGILTLGLPGLSGWRGALAVLEEVKPATVLLALDSDARENKVVARALRQGYRFLCAAGLHVELERWA